MERKFKKKAADPLLKTARIILIKPMGSLESSNRPVSEI
jgi:hypothetical protein